MNCINLRDHFGHRYRITYDDAGQSEWNMQIPCRDGGTISPHGGGILAYAFTSRSSRRLNRLVKLGCTIHQDGDEERCVLFPVELFAAVAKIAKPRKRRIMPPETASHLKQYRFATRRTESKLGPRTAK